MSTYLVTWVEEIIHGVHIEADSEQEAIDKLHAHEYNGEDVEALDSVGVVYRTEEAELV